MNKGLCLLLALLFALAAQLSPGWEARVEDEAAGGTYSLSAVILGLRAAEAAADELLGRQGAPPGLRLRLRLTLRPPSREAGAVADLLLRRTPGVLRGEGCFVNGALLGCAADGEALREALRRHIFATRPPGALSGHYAQAVELRPVYTRAGRAREAAELCSQVSALVPVLHTDAEGRIVSA